MNDETIYGICYDNCRKEVEMVEYEDSDGKYLECTVCEQLYKLPDERLEPKETSNRILERMKQDMVKKSVRELEDSKLDIKACNRDIKKLEKEIADYTQSLNTSKDLLVQYDKFSPIETATKQREILNITEKPSENDGMVIILEWIRQDVIKRNNHWIKIYTNWIAKREKQIKDLTEEKEYIVLYILALEKLLTEYEKIVPIEKIEKWIKEMLQWRRRA